MHLNTILRFTYSPFNPNLCNSLHQLFMPLHAEVALNNTQYQLYLINDGSHQSTSDL